MSRFVKCFEESYQWALENAINEYLREHDVRIVSASYSSYYAEDDDYVAEKALVIFEGIDDEDEYEYEYEYDEDEDK